MKIIDNICIFCGIVLIVSCEQINKSFEETRNPKPKTENGRLTESESHSSSTTITSRTGQDNAVKTAPGIIEDAARLDAIQAELQNLPQFRGKKLMLYMSLYYRDNDGGTISLNIQNPDKKENIDNYEYSNGKWQEPTPVKIQNELLAVDNLVEFLMPLDRIKFSTFKKINDIAKEKLKEIEDGKMRGYIYFSYSYIKSLNRDQSYWYTDIEGSRKDAHLEFDVNGNLKPPRAIPGS